MNPRSSTLIVLLAVLAMATTTALGLLNRAREDRETLREHLHSEQLAAETGAAGVAAVLDGFSSDLDRLTNTPSVRYLKDPERLEKSLRLFRERTTIDSVGLVRIDTTGRVLVMYPEGEVPPEVLEALGSSGYLQRVARPEEPLLTGPIQIAGGENVVALSNEVHSKDSIPLGALITVFPVSALVGPLASLTEAGERSVLLHFENGARLRHTGLETVTRATSAVEPESDKLVARAAVAGEVVPGIDVELQSTREAALAPRHRSRRRGLLLLVLMNGLIGTGGLFLVRETRLRKRLEATEAHYRRLVDTSPHGIYIVDTRGCFVEVNPVGEHILARSAREVVGRPFAEVVMAEDREAVEEAFRRVVSGDERLETEVRIQRSTGEIRLISLSGVAIREEGAASGVYGTARDITEKRAREERMRLLSTALESLEPGISIADAETQGTIYANAAWCRLFGCDPEQYTGHTSEEFLPDAAARKQFEEILHVLKEQGQWGGRVWRRRLNDGEVVPLDAVIGRVTDEDGRALLFSVFYDATEEIEQEQRVRRAERLASVGTLVGGVAHELNNPLNAILNFVQLLLIDERDEEKREDLDTIQHETLRMAKIVADLKQMARDTQEECERSPVDLNEVVRYVLKVRGYSLRTSNIEVREDLAESLPLVLADRGQMEQVLFNLVTNAEQAMASAQSEGRLILRTRRTQAGVSLHIVDNGPGIAPEDMERIFDAFWTSKAPGEGTGLGLSLVHNIVAEHGGEIHVDSEIGMGAAFRVDLPRAPRVEQPSGNGEAILDKNSVKALRVLVVDDEAALRRSLVRYLSRRGHAVEEAAEGDEALRRLDEHEYDVILSDLRMPGLGGEALLERLAQRRLADRLIVITGDAGGGNTARMGVPVLLKPINLEDVAHAVDKHAESRRR